MLGRTLFESCMRPLPSTQVLETTDYHYIINIVARTLHKMTFSDSVMVSLSADVSKPKKLNLTLFSPSCTTLTFTHVNNTANKYGKKKKIKLMLWTLEHNIPGTLLLSRSCARKRRDATSETATQRDRGNSQLRHLETLLKITTESIKSQ